MTTAGIASMPSREDNLHVVIEALHPQLDSIWVWLNGFDAVPRWMLKYGKLHPVAGGDLDLSDAGKLAALPDVQGIFFACDDDLFYPSDYVQRTLEGIDRYEGNRIVGWGGGILKSPPIKSYYADGRTEKRHWAMDQAEDWPCNTLLTCLAAWPVELLPTFSSWACTTPKAVDIWLAIEAQMMGVGMTLLAHRGDWIKHQDIDIGASIWGELHDGKDQAQTDIINRFGQPFRVL